MESVNYQVVIDAVKQAGVFALDLRLRQEVYRKGASDYVTAVDRRISNYLREQLAQLTPDIGFMSEEEESKLQADRWILDPIDGTTNLVYDYNMSSVSLALHCDGVVRFGVIYQPFNGDLFVAERGKGAYLNGKRLLQATDRPLDECLIEFGSGSTQKQYADVNFAIAQDVFASCLDLRRICSSALAIAYVAAGKLNGYFERRLYPWDYAAASLFAEECGVRCCDWSGKPIQYEKAQSFVCGTSKALDCMLACIRRHTDPQ